MIVISTNEWASLEVILVFYSSFVSSDPVSGRHSSAWKEHGAYMLSDAHLEEVLRSTDTCTILNDLYQV